MSRDFTEDMLTSALVRSAELAAVIRVAWEAAPAFDQPRAHAVEGLCAISLGHGAAVQRLLPRSPASAIALVRPQYESLVRGVWAQHVASEVELDRLLAPLTLQSQQSAKKLPGVPEMLVALEKQGPRGAASLLGRARARLGDGLNSYVHGGIHPVARERDGYPIALLLDVLKSSNALSVVSLIVLATLSEAEDLAALLPTLHASFAKVLPTLDPFDN